MYPNFQLNPEFRSITNICVVEDVSKCPLGYTPILRTHDTDTDADLWKDGFFSRKVTRYVCISKSQGKPEHVVQNFQILHDRDSIPESHNIITQTADTNQKAFQKKIICFQHCHFRSNFDSIVEISILAKSKTPPDGFEYIGDINGMHFCCRKVSATVRLNSPSLGVGYALSPSSGSEATGPNSLYPNVTQTFGNLGITSPSSSEGSTPIRAQLAHQQSLGKLNNTLNQLSGIEGVPFVIQESLLDQSDPNAINKRNEIEALVLNNDYAVSRVIAKINDMCQYDFSREREALGGTYAAWMPS